MLKTEEVILMQQVTDLWNSLPKNVVDDKK